MTNGSGNGRRRRDLRRLDLEHVWHPYTEMSAYAEEQLVLVGGDGAFVEDDEGTRYVDAIAGLWNVQVGHGREEIVGAIAEQLRRLPFTPLNGRAHEPAIELAERLAARAPGNLRHVFYGEGGAESVETALKIARQFMRQTGRPGRYKVIGLARGWHGCTLGALSASGVVEEKRNYEPLAEGFLRIPTPHCFRCPYGRTFPECATDCALALERVLEQEGPDTVAAFVAEPVLGLAGMIAPRPEFWSTIQDVCRRHGVLLIVDEVAMGFGRTGRLFASEHFGLEPDLLACAKGITSGYLPLGAVLATDRVYEAFLGPGRSLVHGYTFGGHPAACAAALASLEIIEREGLCERAAELGEELLARLTAGLAGSQRVGEVRGIGLALGVDLVADAGSRTPLPIASELCRRLRGRGILVRPVGWDNVLPLVPPLTIPRETALATVDAYVDVVRELGQETAGERKEPAWTTS